VTVISWRGATSHTRIASFAYM